MRIGLGTAQFGLDYGISNPSGQVAPAEAHEILALAEESGVRIVDTAAAYGDSEERLGRLLAKDHPFSIVTKLPRLPDALAPGATRSWVLDAFERSLGHLGSDRVHGLLIHGAADLLGPRGTELWAALEELRGAGSVAQVGASVYTGPEIDALLKRHPLQLVQVPLNALDQRLVRSGHLTRLKSAGIEVHVRSVFLQGLLLMEPARLSNGHFEPARGALGAFQSAARSAGRSPLQAAVAYAMSVPEVDVAIFGVTSATQFAEILAAATTELPEDWYAPFALEDERILDPSRWPR